MKLRSTFLAFASLLLISSLASAGPISMPADPASANLAAIFSAPASPDCANAKLPSFEPTPTSQAGILCGTCSDTICQGHHSGDVCKFQNGKTYRCQLVIESCSPTDCTCWTGPLP
jgi:hypothetical protein